MIARLYAVLLPISPIRLTPRIIYTWLPPLGYIGAWSPWPEHYARR